MDSLFSFFKGENVYKLKIYHSINIYHAAYIKAMTILITSRVNEIRVLAELKNPVTSAGLVTYTMTRE
jgi:hypothetical protein